MSISLYGFGANHAGQLGVDLTNALDSSPTPAIVHLPKDLVPKKVACGRIFSVSLSENSSTLLLSGMQDSEKKVGQIFEKLWLPSVLQESGAIMDLSVGDSYAAILSSRGELFSCGRLEPECNGGTEERDVYFCVRPVEILIPHRIINVSVGSGHVLALSSAGILFAWGSNNKGQLGIGNTVPFVAQPCEIKSLAGVPAKQVTCGGNHSFVLTISGALFAFGDNSSGQLGLGDEENREYPTLVKFLRSQFIMYMAAGCAHSAALTADGGVFTFGSGKFGQLGHNSAQNENVPRKILELMGSQVIQIACGKNHTLALVRAPVPQLYAFGHGTFGQLGASNESYANALVPVLSRAVMDVVGKATPKQRIRSIFAGGDSCFIVTETVNGVQELTIPDFTNSNFLPSIYHLDVQKIKQILSSTDTRDIEAVLCCVFRSASCLNASFLLPGREHFKCSSLNSGVSISEARSGWHALLTSDRLLQHPKSQELISAGDFVLGFVSEVLLPTLSRNPPDVEALRLYLILPVSARFENPDNYMSLQSPYAAAVNSLEKPAERVLLKWWARFSRDDFARFVLAYKKCCIHIMFTLADSKCSQLLNPIAAHQAGGHFDQKSQANIKRLSQCLEMLKRLSIINEDMRHGQNEKLECSDFYIPELHEYANVREAYIAWWHTRRTPQHETLFNLCNYPFIFDAQAKSILLQTDAQLQMHYAMENARNRAIVNIFVPFAEPEVPFLILQVNRNNILHDTIHQLGAVSRPSDYKKPMKVSFVGEEGDDAGGVRKEFFLLLFREVFDPKYGMFRMDEVSRLNWFNDILDDDESISMYQFIGLLCGLAIYNSIIVDISFPTALFKKLLKKSCTLDDLKELSPIVARSLEILLDYDGQDSVEDVFSLNFETTRTIFDTTQSIELVPGGRSKVVSKENRVEYVEAYVDYIFNKSVSKQFNAFMKGFDLVCSGNVFSLFHPIELQSLVIGNENYDWKIFEKGAEYKGEFHAKHPTIQLFWEVFHELPLEEKKKFLLFLTGSDRIPILGMQAVKIIFQSVKVDDTFLPVAHTCFGLLDLPLYKDKETLKQKLLVAIQHTQGFGIA